MAGNKTVLLKWGEGGPVIGTATIDENGLIMAEIDEEYAKKLGIFKDIGEISLVQRPSAPVEDTVDHGGWEDH